MIIKGAREREKIMTMNQNKNLVPIKQNSSWPSLDVCRRCLPPTKFKLFHEKSNKLSRAAAALSYGRSLIFSFI